jgi:hypothetical protein
MGGDRVSHVDRGGCRGGAPAGCVEWGLCPDSVSALAVVSASLRIRHRHQRRFRSPRGTARCREVPRGSALAGGDYGDYGDYGGGVPPADGWGVVGVVDLDSAAFPRSAGAEVQPVGRVSEEDANGTAA